MSSSYADIADIKATITVAGADTFLDNDLERAALAASQALDDELGRSFGLSDDANDIRTYSPGEAYRTGVLEIDDLAVLTSVRVDQEGDGTWETWTVDADFRLEPLNASALSQPWEQMRAIYLGDPVVRFPSNPLGKIEITGQFGWSEVPTAIAEAAGLIAEQILIRKRQAPLGFVTAGADVGAIAYLARRDPQVSALIRGYYRRRRISSLQLT